MIRLGLDVASRQSPQRIVDGVFRDEGQRQGSVHERIQGRSRSKGRGGFEEQVLARMR